MKNFLAEYISQITINIVYGLNTQKVQPGAIARSVAMSLGNQEAP